ncbi:hypothetical protein MA20_45355 [Bradyrhizobium japonicum]|uniref:Uncharacterized protein n=1 Tax=Bradyrhizobium japonicum TaxID=375 RepID=A0A0A3XJB8_BRAJP|nr:hypothetical protein [Bradyrhizobium japonicum]KGT73261.1 hypothetical protein MA20_45355 [Bradyrhizobium japonicum]
MPEINALIRLVLVSEGHLRTFELLPRITKIAGIGFNKAKAPGAFSKEREAFIGSPEHIGMTKQFGFAKDALPDKPGPSSALPSEKRSAGLPC